MTTVHLLSGHCLYTTAAIKTIAATFWSVQLAVIFAI